MWAQTGVPLGSAGFLVLIKPPPVSDVLRPEPALLERPVSDALVDELYTLCTCSKQRERSSCTLRHVSNQSA